MYARGYTGQAPTGEREEGERGDDTGQRPRVYETGGRRNGNEERQGRMKTGRKGTPDPRELCPGEPDTVRAILEIHRAPIFVNVFTS